jgi:hypothetical protein
MDCLLRELGRSTLVGVPPCVRQCCCHNVLRFCRAVLDKQHKRSAENGFVVLLYVAEVSCNAKLSQHVRHADAKAQLTLSDLQSYAAQLPHGSNLQMQDDATLTDNQRLE